MDIMLAAKPDDDVRRLVEELDDELGALYPPEQRHGLDLDAIFAPHIRFFVARRDGAAVGCGGVALFADFAEVKRMYVRPEVRGKGAANAIMDALIAEARGVGLSLLRLETGSRSLAAIHFYRRNGFQLCDAFEPYASLPPHRIAGSVFLEKPVS
ncbi:MAG TPA: GNAT family N-acetyltransferase [Rhizomicrobium sp.]|nr:GNAT family N-acetyltransferase [Rhizomicrobium sp.]